MITSTSLKLLKANNYVRKASHKNDYWIDFTKQKLDVYIVDFKNFNIVIYSELNSNNYYIIPYKILKNAFHEKFFSKDQTNRKRWVGTIKNHKFKISNYPNTIDVKKYYSNPFEILFEISQKDVEAIEDENDSKYEGQSKARMVNYYERDANLRARAIRFHGTICKVCGFDFKMHYGPHGEDYIEVHHLRPLHTLINPELINARKDMTVLCSNCHRMIHRRKNNQLSIQALLNLWKKNNR